MRKLLVGLLLLAGCVTEPKDGVPYDPPPIYRDWFQRVEECSGRAGNFDRIAWFTMAGEKFYANGQRVVAMWYPGHRIYLAAPDTLAAFVVQHEMLHDILNGAGHEHPAFRACRLLS